MIQNITCMNNILFSIILPAYNAEKYIKQCIESLLEQSYNYFEIIIINDGSTDRTLDIIKTFLRKDSRIKLINKKNEGVSIARNRGLAQAIGEYIIFVDADDLVNKNLLSTLYLVIKEFNNELDYIRYEYQTIDQAGNHLYPNYERIKRKKYNGKVINSNSCIKNIVRNEFFLWSGAFKKDIINKNKIFFKEGCTYNEDTLFMVSFFLYSKNHIYIKDIMYKYRKYENAATSTFTKQNYEDVKGIFLDLVTKLNNDSEIDFPIRNSIKNVTDTIGLRLLNYIITQNNDKNFKNTIIKICINNPTRIEWKTIKNFGFKIGFKFIFLFSIYKRIIRKLHL